MNPNPILLFHKKYNYFIKNKQNKCGIYCIIGLEKSWLENNIYIGSAKNIQQRIIRGHLETLRRGKHQNNVIQNYYNKYKEDKICIFLLEECEESQLIALEQEYIDFYGVAANKKSFNISDKASGGRGPVSQERIERMKAIYAKEKNPFYNKKHSKESIERMRLAKIGKKMSDEAKNNMRKAQTGRKHSLETKEKIRKANTGRVKSNESRELIRAKKQETFYALDINSGFVYEFVNLRKFCKEQKIHRGSFLSTRKQQRRKRCKNWVLMDKDWA